MAALGSPFTAQSYSCTHPTWSYPPAYTPGTMPQLSRLSAHSRQITDEDDDDEDAKKEKIKPSETGKEALEHRKVS